MAAATGYGVIRLGENQWVPNRRWQTQISGTRQLVGSGCCLECRVQAVQLSLGEERGFPWWWERRQACVPCSQAEEVESGIKHGAQGATQHSISVTAGSVGPAAPGAVQWCNKTCSSSTLCSGQAPNRASQGGSCNWVWGQTIWSSTAGMELVGSNLKTSRGRLRLPAQGRWLLS